MRERKKRDPGYPRKFFCRTLLLIFFFASFPGILITSIRSFFGEERRPELIPRLMTEEALKLMGGIHVEAKSDYRSSVRATVMLREIINLPDQVLIILENPYSVTINDLDCIYTSTERGILRISPMRVEVIDQDVKLVRCPLPPIGSAAKSIALKSGADVKTRGATVPQRWDSLAYEAVIDRDNSTVVFVKGLNLRPEKLYDSARFECVYGWNFSAPRLVLRTDAVSVAQEIVRCKTPLSVLSRGNSDSSIMVSVRMKGKKAVGSIARPSPWAESFGKKMDVCICTMLRNQAKFLREWATYHASIGVQHFFIYDNNSDDDIEDVIASLSREGIANISRTVWPWIKTQEAGFSHCTVRLRGRCDWVGFIDVDEFFYLPWREMTLSEAIKNQSSVSGNMGELRVPCYNFGPSGLKNPPEQGVTVGYTCRLAVAERHKSIINPEAVNRSLINVVHHFHLREGFEAVHADRGVLALNHYKYQVWSVFKEKFYRRVAAYVADWQEEGNVGSKDRTPGLGTRALEPPDWSNRFCQVHDLGLRDLVLRKFADPSSNLLPWHAP